MKYNVEVYPQHGGSPHTLEIKCAAAPDGFAVGSKGGLDWLTPPQHVAGGLTRLILTGGREVAAGLVRFDQRIDGQAVELHTSNYSDLAAALTWFEAYNKAATLARDRFWEIEADTTPAPPGCDFGESFL